MEILEPEFRKRHGSVVDFLGTYESGVMLVFVHRDSENVSLRQRLGEFEEIARPNVVPVVPVQMSEAWILFDGAAIAKAAGSPGSRVPVPAIRDIEGISNPKERLDRLLFRAASSPTGRRGRNFKRSIVDRRVSVAEYISDYAPLRHLPAFRRFQRSRADRYPYSGQLGR